MSAEERRAYQDDGPPPPDVAPHIAALQWAEGLIFVYPTWWYAQPAMLKGWMDRVWRPGVTFTVPSPGAPMRPALTNIRLIGVITTFGAPWWLWTFVMGAPGRRMILRGLRLCTAKRTKTFWLGLHELDTVDARSRNAFVARVAARIRRIAV
jgi:putative NADPH-quinone reductase